jgi:hypothetical protein
MKAMHILAGGAALVASFVVSGIANAAVLYDNLGAASRDIESVFDNSGYNSFSTGSSSFFFSDVSLLMDATDPGDGGQFQLALFADNLTSPGAEIAPSSIYFDSILSSTLGVKTFSFGDVLLSPGTRYWIELDSDGSVNWSYSNDTSGPGVAGEYFADTRGPGHSLEVFPNDEAGGPFQMAVPGVAEPSTWAMMATGFAGLAFAGFRSSRRGVAVG